MKGVCEYQGVRLASTDPAGPTGKLCEWLAALRLADVPADVQARAKAIVLDGLGCAIVGAQLPWSVTAVETVSAFEGAGDKTIIGWGRTLASPAAALLNGTFIQGFELDDFHPFAPLHSASLVIPAALACSEELGGVSGERLLLAAVAGFEVGPRVGLALHGGQMLSRGWHSGSVFGTHAAAAAAGSLLKLDAARFEDALGHAGTQSAGLMAAQFEAMSKRMHHGFSSRNGLYAAYLANGGYTGIKRVFERDFGGFLSVFGEGHDPDATQIAAELGERWETRRIAIKPYAAMGSLHGAIDGIFDIMRDHPFRPEDVQRIQVDMTHSGYHHGWWPIERPITPITAQMNVAYALAVAILDGEAMIRQFSPARIDRDDVWELIPKIEARHDPSLDGPSSRKSRVTVFLKGGGFYASELAAPRTVLQPLTNDGVISKFKVLTNGVIDQARQAQIIETVMALETLPEVSKLVGLLSAPVGSAF